MNRAALSDYTYHIRRDGQKPVIVITDLNLGRMSVTNNIEAVVDAVCKSIGLSTREAEIIYRDSDGAYDRVWEYDSKMLFAPLVRLQRIESEDEAVAAALAEKIQW